MNHHPIDYHATQSAFDGRPGRPLADHRKSRQAPLQAIDSTEGIEPRGANTRPESKGIKTIIKTHIDTREWSEHETRIKGD